MAKIKLGTQIFITSILIAILSLTIVSWAASDIGREFYLQKTAQSLENHAVLIRDLLVKFSNTQQQIQNKINRAKADLSIRVTIIDSSGLVLGDSHKDPRLMDNHRSRPEIETALQKGSGQSMRFSNTIKRELMYFALAVDMGEGNKWVVRTSESIQSIEKSIHIMQSRIFFSGFVVALFALLAGFFISGKLTRPIEEIVNKVRQFSGGDFSEKLHKPSTPEFALLADSLNKMAFQLNDKMQTIIRQKHQQIAVFKSMAEGVIAVDYEANIISINKAAYALLAIKKKDVHGLYIRSAIQSAQIENFFLNVLRTGHTIEDEVIITTQKEQCLKINTRVLQNEMGDTIGALMVLNDLTRVRNLEDGRREFVANVSHELRTPLTSIKGFAEALHEGAIEDKVQSKKFVDIIYTQANRLGHILEDILTLSRLDKDEAIQQVAMDKQHIHAVIESAVATCFINAEKKQIRIDMDLDKEVVLNLNQSLMEEALINLVDNAIKYSEPGTKVRVRCKTHKNKCIITVKDQGQGIDQEHLSRIFERFYRVDKARSRTQGGTGLGLAIVKHIAIVHKGSIDVTSASGEGSTFKLTLPL